MQHEKGKNMNFKAKHGKCEGDIDFFKLSTYASEVYFTSVIFKATENNYWSKKKIQNKKIFSYKVWSEGRVGKVYHHNIFLYLQFILIK